MALSPLQFQQIDNTEKITSKTYGRGGGAADSNNYCTVYRLGDVRILRFKFTDSTAFANIFTLDLIDKPTESVQFIAGDTGYSTRVYLTEATPPQFCSSETHTGVVVGMVTYVTKATSV